MAAPEGTLHVDSIEMFLKMDRLHLDLKKTAQSEMNLGPQRKGQAYFNALVLVAPELAELIRGTKDDPFYDDGNLPAFMTAIFGKAEFDY